MTSLCGESPREIQIEDHQRMVHKRISYVLEHSACRICRDEGDITEVIAPCSCAGAIRNVHVNCLAKWISSGLDGIRARCEICKTNYHSLPLTLLRLFTVPEPEIASISTKFLIEDEWRVSYCHSCRKVCKKVIWVYEGDRKMDFCCDECTNKFRQENSLVVRTIKISKESPRLMDSEKDLESPIDIQKTRLLAKKTALHQRTVEQRDFQAVRAGTDGVIEAGVKVVVELPVIAEMLQQIGWYEPKNCKKSAEEEEPEPVREPIRRVNTPVVRVTPPRVTMDRTRLSKKPQNVRESPRKKPIDLRENEREEFESEKEPVERVRQPVSPSKVKREKETSQESPGQVKRKLLMVRPNVMNLSAFRTPVGRAKT